MYYYNYIGILVFFSLMICASVIFLNTKNNKDTEMNKKHNLYSLLVGNFNNLCNGKKRSDLVYLAHNRESMLSMENTIKDIFLKVIIILNTKDVNKIKSCDFISERMKQSILLNIEKVNILPIKQVKSVEIISVIDNKIDAIINSNMIQKDGEKEENIVDRWFFTNGKTILLESMEVKVYRQDNFIHMSQMLKIEDDKKEVLA